LNKALYGLRRSALYWFQTLVPVIKSLGFSPFGVDTCIFQNTKLNILILLYVDDMLVARATNEKINNVMNLLGNHFEIKAIGEVKRFLGFDVIRDRKAKTIFLSQEAFTTAAIAKFGFAKHHAVKSPWPARFELPKTWQPINKKKYLKITRSLNWLATGTRLDIAYTVSRLCEANNRPSKKHMELVDHLFRYLVGTKSLGLVFGGNWQPKDLGLKAFADASFADDLL